MFNKLKGAISRTNEEQNAKKTDLSFLNIKEVEQYKTITLEATQNIEEIGSLIKSNKDKIKEFIQEQRQSKEKGQKQHEDEETYTFEQDIVEIKTLLGDVLGQISKLQQSNEEIKDRMRGLGQIQTPQKMQALQDQLRKCQTELKQSQASEQNNKEILTTLKNQTQLLSKQTKDLQQKCSKLEKELNQKNFLVTNLQEEKKVLLELRNAEGDNINPEIQLLKNQVMEGDKKISIERTKVAQKEKEIENLKKKMEEDRDSLQKIADELKEKQLKSKKILDKYQRSKTQIRKYREEKTQFIKKLNIEIANLTDRATKLEAQNSQLSEKLRQANDSNEELEAQITKNEGKDVDLESAKSQIKLLREQQISLNGKIEEKQAENNQLKGQVDQLQSKRKTLLEALQKPINHEIRTLDKIIRALEKLYKQYIDVVFTQGNIIGFENRISHILSNVIDIKEDLKL